MAAKMSFGLAKQQSAQLEAAIKQLRQQVMTLVDKVEKQESAQIVAENADLKVKISSLKKQLVAKEVANGVEQVALPKRQAATITPAAPGTESAAKTAAASQQEQPKKKKEKKEKPAGAKAAKGGAEEERAVDVSRLALRVGLIEEAVKHPDADGLYVETVHLGEEQPRTIVSGLVKHIPLEQMQNRLAVFMTNLKPAKMRGIMSQGMIMCASTPEKVEILDCPAGAKAGDLVTVAEYPGEPDTQLNPKKKIWEQIQPELRVSADGVACYKGAPLVIGTHGQLKAPTMRDCPIK